MASSSHPPIPVGNKRIKQETGTGVAAVMDISANWGNKAAPHPRGERPGKLLEDVIIKEKTIGKGRLAEVGSIVKVYHQFRGRNGPVFYKQLEGEPVSSPLTIIFVWLNPCRTL